YFYRSYGTNVTVVEALPRLLPNEDEDVSRQMERSLRAQGIDVRTNTYVDQVVVKENSVAVRVSAGDRAEDISSEYVLLGVGFEPNTTDLELETAGVELDAGWVKIDGYCRTNVPGIWAIGDLTGRMLLAHVASHQGVVAVEKIAGLEPQPVDYDQMPRAVYCQPQVASLGLSEEDARERGIDVRTGRFPFRANGKAMATGETDGFVKLVVDNETGEVIGCHVIGYNATELLGEASLGRALETTIAELGRAVHAHPTFAEAVKEAALAVTGEAIHFYSKRTQS
ncbi:MAG TPA: FAD-dependent oxidoreductase, partial [Dehalococcoidia bacterium]|nr:FAD-dependent oxidoreductase [Dehalococcoidia bacterium]